MKNPTPGVPIRVLIAEDHPIMRQGLGVVLDAYEDLTLVGEAENGEQAVNLAQELKPDVIVMDIQMPVKDGLTAIQEIASLGLEVRILVLTSYPDDDKVFQAIKAGAMGYFLKETRSDDLAEAIRLVQRGQPRRLIRVFRKTGICLEVVEVVVDPATIPVHHKHLAVDRLCLHAAGDGKHQPCGYNVNQFSIHDAFLLIRIQ